MARTIESYLRESGEKPIENLYDFSNEGVWPTERLFETLQADRDNLQKPEHGEARRQALGRVVAHKMFELTQRIGEEATVELSMPPSERMTA